MMMTNKNGAEKRQPQQPLSLEFIDEHIGADEGDREAVIALVREVEAAHGITAQADEDKTADFPTIRVRRASEEALMRQADEDGRFLNAQGHQQAIDAIDFCLTEFSRAAATAPAGGVKALAAYIGFLAGCGDTLDHDDVVNELKKVHATLTAARAAEPVAEVYRLHYGGRMRNIGTNAIRQLVPSDKLPPPGTKLYAASPTPPTGTSNG